MRALSERQKSFRKEVKTMFGLGFAELAVIAAIAILFFGAPLIRRTAKQLGGALREGKKAVSELKSSLQ